MLELDIECREDGRIVKVLPTWDPPVPLDDDELRNAAIDELAAAIASRPEYRATVRREGLSWQEAIAEIVAVSDLVPLRDFDRAVLRAELIDDLLEAGE